MKKYFKFAAVFCFLILCFSCVHLNAFASTSNVYEFEAEDGVLSGPFTQIGVGSNFSNGAYVRHLRYDGTCEIAGYVSHAGFYKVEVDYAAGETGSDILLTVNDTYSEVIADDYGGLGWNVVKTSSPSLIYFNKGINIMVFSKAGEKSFDVDKITLTYVGNPTFEEEAENGTISGPFTTTTQIANASNGYTVRHLRYGGSCDINLELPVDGFYTVKIYYSAGEENCDLTINIGEELNRVIDVDYTGDYYTVDYVSISNVYLTKGAKLISLFKAGDRTPDLDKIEIELTGSANNLIAVSNLQCNTVGTIDRLTWEVPEYRGVLMYDIYLDDIYISTTQSNMYANEVKSQTRNYTIIARTYSHNLSSAPQSVSSSQVANIVSVINGDFEEETGNNPVAGWGPSNLSTGIISSASIHTEENGNQSLRLVGNSDSAYHQCITGLIPNESYILRGKVRVLDLNNSGNTNGIGPSIFVVVTKPDGSPYYWYYGKNDNKSFPNDYTVDAGWIEQEIEFVASESGCVYIGGAIGRYSSNISGEFLFDDFELIQKETNILETDNIRFHFTNDDIDLHKKDELDYFMGELDKAYNLYAQLIGRRHDGERILNIVTRDNMSYGGLTLTGSNVITWNCDSLDKQIKPELDTSENAFKFSFGLFHEMGHMYDIGDWAWNGEFSANFKMLYVIKALEQENSTRYRYVDIISNYKSEYEKEYTATSSHTNAGFLYLLSKVADTVGWDVFQNVYSRYFSENITVSGAVNRLDKFLDLIEEEAQKKSGFEDYQITDTISASDLQIAYDYYA